eukprot:51846-Eustigmatos_ZCMA.PRE.1
MSHWLEWLSDNEEDLRVHGVDVRHVMLLVDPHAVSRVTDIVIQYRVKIQSASLPSLRLDCGPSGLC